jgi:hypothetical protein
VRWWQPGFEANQDLKQVLIEEADRQKIEYNQERDDGYDIPVSSGLLKELSLNV